ncbi:hypothetical protein D3C80_1820370 [compost metagenome]
MSTAVEQVGFTLIVDGVRVFELMVGLVPPSGFRLPPLRGRRWQVEVRGTAEVERITLGGSMAEVCLQ